MASKQIQPFLLETQIGFVFENLENRPDQLAIDINSELNQIFDSIPITVPLPQDPSFDTIPVVQMKSNDGHFICNVARARLDFFMQGNGKQSFIDVQDSFLSNKDRVLDYLFKHKKATRIAFITKFFVEDKESAKSVSNALTDDFKQLFDGTELATNITYTTKLNFNQIIINNYAHFESNSNWNIEGKSTNGAIITRDFNSSVDINQTEKLNKKVFDDLIEFGVENFKLEEIISSIWQVK